MKSTDLPPFMSGFVNCQRSLRFSSTSKSSTSSSSLGAKSGVTSFLAEEDEVRKWFCEGVGLTVGRLRAEIE